MYHALRKQGDMLLGQLDHSLDYGHRRLGLIFALRQTIYFRKVFAQGGVIEAEQGQVAHPCTHLREEFFHGVRHMA